MKTLRTILLPLVVFFTTGAVAQNAGYWRSDTFCLNTSIQYTNTITINGNPPQWWAWSMPGATPDTAYSTSSATSPTFTFTQEGFYTVTLTMRLANGEDTSIYADVLALDPAPPANTVGDDTAYCGPFVRILDAGNAGSEYLWSTGSQAQTIQVITPGTYSVDVSNKCYSGTFDIVIDQNPLPAVDLGPDAFVCQEAPKDLYSGTAIHTYVWNTGETTPTITTGLAGSYAVTVTTADGCSSFDEIVLRDSCPPDLLMPDAFTPNRDGRNDTLIPYTNGIDSIHFAVFNRWGEKMYETNTLGEGWNGFFGGVPVQNDIYIWKITALDTSGNKHNRKGIIVLYR